MIREIILVALLGCGLFISALWRMNRAIRRRRKADVENIAFRSADAWLLIPPVCSIAFFLAVISIVSVVFSGEWRTLILVLLATVLVSCMSSLIAVVIAPPREKPNGEWYWITCLTWMALSIAAPCVAFILRGTPQPVISLDYPVAGGWRVEEGGRTMWTNRHSASSQAYAVDMVATDGESEGKPVYAPIAGEVIHAIDTPDEASTQPPGSCVIIRTAEGVDLWLAHLREGSVRVAQGDWVESGDHIAAVGATGSATRAHLHIHAESNNNPVAMQFGPDRKFLLRNRKVIVRDE